MFASIQNRLPFVKLKHLDNKLLKSFSSSFQTLVEEIPSKMSMATKRKSSDPIQNLPCGFDGLLVKKSKSSGVLKFSMENKSVKSRVLHIVKLLSCHIFATPFLRSEEDESSSEYQQSFDDVLEKIETNIYENSQQVFDDLTDILDESTITQKKTKSLNLKC